MGGDFYDGEVGVDYSFAEPALEANGEEEEKCQPRNFPVGAEVFAEAPYGVDDDEEAEDGAAEAVDIFYPGMVWVEGMVDILLAEVFFIIGRQLIDAGGWNPAAKTAGPIGATHAALGHTYYSSGENYDEGEKENETGVTDVRVIGHFHEYVFCAANV